MIQKNVLKVCDYKENLKFKRMFWRSNKNFHHIYEMYNSGTLPEISFIIQSVITISSFRVQIELVS